MSDINWQRVSDELKRLADIYKAETEEQFIIRAILSSIARGIEAGLPIYRKV